MKKNVLFFLLLFFVMYAMMGNMTYAADETDAYVLVKKQIDAYGKSIAIPNSDEKTLNTMVTFSALHGGEHLSVGEDHEITASLFNSNLLKECLSYSIVNGVELMGKLDREQICAKGSLLWYTHRTVYQTYACEETEKGMKTLDVISTTRELYGQDGYQGVMNEHDKALILVVGACYLTFDITEIGYNGNNTIYDVTIKVYDDFDFQGTYEKDTEMGYDTTFAKLLTGIGKNSLNPYTWEANVEFQVEVPNTCQHVSGAYQWNWDEENETLVSNAADGYIENNTVKHTQINGESSNLYYELEDSIILCHDKPWVIEYKGCKINQFGLSSASSVANDYLAFRHLREGYTFMFETELMDLTEEEKERYQEDYMSVCALIRHCRGIDAKKLYSKFYGKNTLTFRIENVVNEDGSNMPYITVVNSDTGDVLIENMPMNLYYTRKNSEYEYVTQRTEDNHLSGKDLRINYIGNQSHPVQVDDFQLTIWENGEGAEIQASMETGVKTGTCIRYGGTHHHCTKCNYGYLENLSYGDHSFGTYVSNDNADCVTDSTKTAVCKYCGVKKTVSEPGTALGHVEKKVRNCSATCTKAGYIGGTICKRCDAVVVPNTVIPAKGHNYDNWIITKASTCQNEGLKRRDCKVCNHYEEQVVETAEHNWSANYIVDQPATFEKEGVQSIRCTDCDELKMSVTIPKLQKASCDKILAYTGSQSTPDLRILNAKGEKLAEGTDYTYVVRNIRNAIVKEPKAIGDYIIDITYIGKYSGNTKLNYSIVPSAPEKLTLELTAHDDVKLTWTKSKLADAYLVYYKKAAAKTYTFYGAATSTTATIKNLDDNVKYNFKVLSYGMSNGQRVESKDGRVASISTLRNLAAPKTLTLKLTGHDDIKVSWSKVKNAKGYFVYYKESAQTFYKSYKITTNTSLVLRNLIDDAEYDIKVVPYGISGKIKVQSDNGREKSILTLENLKAPKNLKLKAVSKTSLNVSWNKTVGAKGYYVYYKVAGTKTYKRYKVTTETSLKITGLKKNTKYAVKVVPYGVSGKVKVQSSNYSVKNIKI